MKRFFLIALTMSTIVFATQVMAAEVDMSKMTCKDAAAMEPAKMAAVGMWMSGFAAGRANNMMVDTDKMAANAQKLKDYCSKTPGSTLMDAMSKM